MPTETFTPDDSFNVPSGVSTVEVELEGESGDQSFLGSSDAQPGDGGRVAGTIDVSNVSTLYIRDSPGGTNGEPSFDGGDSVDIRIGGTTLNDRVAVAAGGGGTGSGDFGGPGGTPGGDGGADTGQDGQTKITSQGGEGGSQTDGGSVGAEEGSFGAGGDGGSGTEPGGGGGAGWYGGAGGQSGGGGGGGGSNYDDGLATVDANERGGSSRTRSQGSIVTITYTVPPAAPSVSASYVADDQIDVDVTADTSGGTIDNFEVEMQRDGGSWVSPSGGPSSPGSGGTYSYGPSSDEPYDSQVGIDSSFEFRVRAVNSGGSSDWVNTGTVKTTPVPPHDPSVSRPDANEIVIEWTDNSDTANKTSLFARKDAGSGYGSWSYRDSISIESQSKGTQRSVSAAVGDDSWMEEDARYQFRFRHETTAAGRDSEYVYADYGNEGNVYFEDDFESGDLSAWDATSLTDSNSGVTQSGNGDLGTNGADEGSYFVQLVNNDYIQANLGDLSGESGVHVRCAMASGSLDADSEENRIRWYDGSSWSTVANQSWEYNRQGWVEVHALIPDSDLSTDNRVRVQSHGGGPVDFAAFDRVVVSDILHEYTEPAVPSNLSLDAGTQREITGTWDLNASVADTAVRDTETWFAPTDESLNGANRAAGLASYTFDGLLDGERYRLEVNDSIIQYRRGSEGLEMDSDRVGAEATTILPAPTGFDVSNVTDSTADYAWQSNHNYGDVLVQYKPTDAGSWTAFATRDRNATAETVTGLRNGEAYDARMVANTEHAQTEDDS